MRCYESFSETPSERRKEQKMKVTGGRRRLARISSTTSKRLERVLYKETICDHDNAQRLCHMPHCTQAIPEVDVLEKQKHKAVEQEDFDKAKECKRNIREIIDALKLQYNTITGKAKRPPSSDSNMKGDRTYSYRAGDLRIDTEKIQLPNLDSDDESRPRYMNRRKPPSRDSNSSGSSALKHRQHGEVATCCFLL